MSAAPFLEALTERRSIYAIGKDKIISDKRVEEIVQAAIKYTPTSFNGQTCRAVVLLNEESDKFWDITTEILKAIVPADSFQATADKMAMFKGGVGTVLFYEDMSIVRGQQEKFAIYEANFPIWSNQSSGMAQLVVWTALEKEGYGATLQHYGNLVKEKVAATWDISADWELIAQMPFGSPVSPAGEKAFIPIEERVKSFGAK